MADSPPAASSDPGPATWRRRAATGGKWLLVGLALWLVSRLLGDIGWRDLADRLGGADGVLLAAVVVCLFGRAAAWAWRWRLAAVRLGPVPGFGALFVMLLASATVNHLTPAARVLGGLLRARYLARSAGGGVGRAYGGVLYDQIAHQVAMTAVTLLAAVGAAAATGRTELAGWLAAAIAAAAAAAAVWWRWRAGRAGGGRRGRLARFLAERAARAQGRTHRLLAHGREAVAAVARLAPDRRLAVLAFALGLVYALGNAGAQWLTFLALGTRGVSFLVVLAVVALGTAAGILLGTPGGIGASEATMIAAFAALGVDRLDATAATLLYRGLHYLTLLAVGGPGLVWLEATLGRPRGVAAATAAPGSDDPAAPPPAGRPDPEAAPPLW